MWIGRTAQCLAALAVAATLTGAAPALAVDIAIGSGGRNVIRDNRLDLQILESRERRRDFQDQQQQFRAQDRRQNAPQTLEVPRMQGSCSVQVRGSKFLRTCR